MSVEVLENLVRARPLAGGDDEVDVATSAPIERMVGDAPGIDAERSQLVAPGHGGALILERADGLPAVEARVADRHWRFLGQTPERAWETHPSEGTPTRARSPANVRC